MDRLVANREYYRKHSEQYDVDEQPFIHQKAFVRRLLLGLRDATMNARLLDFGSGTGSATQVLTEVFPAAEVHGIDISPEMVAIAARKCPTAHFQVCDGTIPATASSFDGVLISSVLHHVPDPRQTLLEVARVCRRPAWVLITQEPNPRVNRWINRIRRFVGDVPEEVKRAEGYQFSPEGGIPPVMVTRTCTAAGFACELIYNNHALLDCLTRKPALYHLLRPLCLGRWFPFQLSYNVVARR